MPAFDLDAALAQPEWSVHVREGRVLQILTQGSQVIGTMFSTRHPHIPYEVIRESDKRAWRVHDKQEALLCLTGQLRP